MANNQEILQMLATGKITSEEAADMLNNPAGSEIPEPKAAPAPPQATKQVAPTPAPTPKTGNTPNWFRVRVTNLETGKNKVSVNIPLRMLRLGLKIGGRFAPELKDIDWQEMDSLMHDLEESLLVEVIDEEDNEHVRVYVE